MLKFALGTVVISLVQNSIQEVRPLATNLFNCSMYCAPCVGLQLVMLTAVYHTFAAAFWAFSPFDTWQLRILASLSDAVPAITIVFTMLAVLYPGQSGLLGPLSIAMIGFVMAAFILLLVRVTQHCISCAYLSLRRMPAAGISMVMAVFQVQ